MIMGILWYWLVDKNKALECHLPWPWPWHTVEFIGLKLTAARVCVSVCVCSIGAGSPLDTADHSSSADLHIHTYATADTRRCVKAKSGSCLFGGIPVTQLVSSTKNVGIQNIAVDQMNEDGVLHKRNYMLYGFIVPLLS